MTKTSYFYHCFSRYCCLHEFSLFFSLLFIDFFLIIWRRAINSEFQQLTFSQLISRYSVGRLFFANSASHTIASSNIQQSFATTQSVGHMIDKLFEFDLRRFELCADRQWNEAWIFKFKFQMLSIYLKDQRLNSISEYDLIFNPYIVFATALVNGRTNCTQTFESMDDTRRKFCQFEILFYNYALILCLFDIKSSNKT